MPNPLITIETLGGDSNLIYSSASNLPSEEEVIGATITDNIIVIINSDNEENGDAYQATVTVNSEDDTKNDITWTKIGNNRTVEGTLSIIVNTAPNNPITADDVKTLLSTETSLSD